MVWPKGESLSSALAESVLCAMETETPSLTSAAACLRLAGVMRLTAPIWSSLPQRPQLESSVIHWSTMAAVTAWVDWAGVEGARANAAVRMNRMIANLWNVCIWWTGFSLCEQFYHMVYISLGALRAMRPDILARSF